jgi:quercetin dioxygenase-like cupin family protein
MTYSGSAIEDVAWFTSQQGVAEPEIRANLLRMSAWSDWVLDVARSSASVPFGGMALSAQTSSLRHYHEEQDEWFYCLAGAYVVEIGDQRFRLGPGDSVLGPRRVPHAFVDDGAGPGRILIGFTPAVRIEQFFRDLEKRGEYFGNGTPEDKELVHRLYGIVNVGPPLKL